MSQHKVSIITVTMNPAVDLFAVTETIHDDSKSRCERASQEPGGGGINVARNLNRLGTSALVVFPAGGLNGKLLGQLLDKGKTPHQAVDIEDDTRQNFAITQRSTGKMHHFVFPGPDLSVKEQQACKQAVLDQARHADYLILSGSIPASVDEHFYGDIIRTINSYSDDNASKHAPRIILDSSGRALKGALKTGAYLAKLNRKEFAELGYDENDDIPTLATQIKAEVHKGAVEVLIVTLNKGGAVLVSKTGEKLFMMPPRVAIKSHVGAGDSFVSALAWQLQRNASLEQAFKYGVAAACTTVQCEGNQLTDLSLFEEMYQATEKKTLE